MARRSSESHTGRNALIAGASLGLVAVAAGRIGLPRLQQRRAGRPDMTLEWSDKPLHVPGESDSANLALYTESAHRHKVAVLGVDASAFDERVRAGGRPGIAISRMTGGSWRGGVAPGGVNFGERGSGENRRVVVAIGLGSEALGSTVVGVHQEDQFQAFDTEILGVTGARDFRQRFPDAPLVASPSPDIFATTPAS
jgi:hypothetical protein